MAPRSNHPLQGHGSRFRAAALLSPPAVFMLCWGVYDALIRYLHYGWGFVPSWVTLASAIGLLTTFAWVSFALVQLGLGAPTTATSTTYASRVKTYAWHLVDLVPFMHAEQSLGMPNPPAQLARWAMGAPILTFRVLVGAVVFTAIRKAWLAFVPGDATSRLPAHA